MATSPIIVGAAIGAAVGLGLSLVGLVRKPARHLNAMTSRRIDVHSAEPPAAVFERLKSFKGDGKLRVVATDEAARKIIFQSNMSFATWGFDFPVYVTDENGGSKVEVGCVSRSIQWGPLVTRAHQNLVDMLKQHLGITS